MDYFGANEEKRMKWIIRAREIQGFHVSHKRENENWRIEDTARLLNRSIGSISEHLLLASWLRTHEHELKRIRNFVDAVAWVRKKEKEMELGIEIERWEGERKEKRQQTESRKPFRRLSGRGGSSRGGTYPY